MNRKDIKAKLVKITNGVETVLDPIAKSIITELLNLVEIVVSENSSLKDEKQRQADEINKLKGEQGKPKIRKQKNNDAEDKDNKDHSSEKERKQSNTEKKGKRKKKGNINIDRQVICKVDKDNLPDDIQFKGYEYTIIQGIIIKTDNVEYQRETYYSASLKKTYIAALPEGCSGEFSPETRAHVISLYHDSKMTQPAIGRFFATHNTPIARSTISRMLTDNHEEFHQEKADIITAGLQSTQYQHLDDTGARVNGKNHYTHILCNPFYTAYFTVPKKDRITVLETLCQEELKFTFNSASFQLMTECGLPDKHLSALQGMRPSDVATRAEVDTMLNQLFPSSKKKKQKKNRKTILEAAAIVFYKASPYAIEYLMCDDAPQFNNIAEYKALCWVHKGRHYKKLKPIVPLHREILDNFIHSFWTFYRELLAYKNAPTIEKAQELSAKFDEIFTEKTGYDQLDERIAKTYAKKATLLLVLAFPFLPLHNNPAELGARVQARHRDINLQTRNDKGTKAKDTFATLVQTARKLNVTFFEYVKDRISKNYAMPSLASLIRQYSQPASDTS